MIHKPHTNNMATKDCDDFLKKFNQCKEDNSLNVCLIDMDDKAKDSCGQCLKSTDDVDECFSDFDSMGLSNSESRWLIGNLA